MKKSIFALIITSLIINFSAAQIVLPAPHTDYVKDFGNLNQVNFYGAGEVTTQSFDEFSESVKGSGKLMAVCYPNKHVTLLISYNKGVNAFKKDSIDFKNTIVFPENSSNAFMFSAAFPFFIDKEKRRFQITPSVNYSYQNCSVKDSDSKKDYSFVVSNFSPALQLNWYAYGSNRFRVMGSINYSFLEVDQGKDSFKAAFDKEHIPTSYKGIGFKLITQLNDLSLYFQLQNLKSDSSIDGITGQQVIVGTTFTGYIFGFLN